MANKTFNLIIAGVGGQGIITSVSILDEACLLQGFDVKSSELHGLSQRGGSVLTHIRFGKKVYSPMVESGGADLLIGLELTETLRFAGFAGKNANFVVNNHYMPFEGNLPKEEILGKLKGLAKEKLHLVLASDACEKKLQKQVLAGVYLLGYASLKKLIPIKPEFMLKAIENIIPEKYREINIKAFNLSKND